MPFDFLKPKPKSTVTRYPTDFLLGDLLVKAGLVSQQQLDEAVKLAGSKNVHVGQMLINFRYISPRDLQAAVDAQSMLRDRTIDQHLAAGCLKIACKTGMTFAEVVRDQHAGTGEGSSNKLGELLSEAGLVTKDQLAKSMGRSQATGLPLGRILVLNGALPDAILTMALEIQVRIRDGMMTREEAIDALRTAGGGEEGAEPQNVEETMRMTIMQPRKKGVRLGELMVMAGLLNETDVMNALELGLVSSQQIGQVLVEQGYVSDELLGAALELQRRIDEDKLTPQDGAEALKQIKLTGKDVASVLETIDEQVAEAESKQIVSFDKMLMLARVVSQDDIDNALEKSAKNAQLLAKVLHMTGYIDEMTMQCVLQCYTMMSNGFLTQDDAIVTLDYCLNRQEKISFAEALAHIGWNATLPMQVHGATSVDISQVKLGLFGTKADTVEAKDTGIPSKAELDAIGMPASASAPAPAPAPAEVAAAAVVDESFSDMLSNSSPVSAPAEPPPMLASLLDEMLDDSGDSSAEAFSTDAASLESASTEAALPDEFVLDEFVAEEFVFDEPVRDELDLTEALKTTEEPQEELSLIDAFLDDDDSLIEAAVMKANDSGSRVDHESTILGEPVGEFVEEPVGEFVEEPVGEVAEPVGEVAEPVGEVAESVGEVAESVGEVAEPVGEVVEPVGEVAEPVGEVAEPVGEVAEPVGEFVEEPVGEVVEPVGEGVEPLGEATEPAASDSLDDSMSALASETNEGAVTETADQSLLETGEKLLGESERQSLAGIGTGTGSGVSRDPVTEGPRDEVPSMLGSLLDEISNEMDLKAILSESLPKADEPIPLDQLALNNESDRDLERKRELEEARGSSNDDFEKKGGSTLLSGVFGEAQDADRAAIESLENRVVDAAREEVSEEAVDASTSSYDNLPAFFKVLVDQEKAKSESQTTPDVDEVMNALDSVLGGEEAAEEKAPEPVAQEESPANENKLVSLSELRGLFSSEKGTNGGGKGAPKSSPTDSAASLLDKLLPPDPDKDVVKKGAAAEPASEVETASAKSEVAATPADDTVMPTLQAPDASPADAVTSTLAASEASPARPETVSETELSAVEDKSVEEEPAQSKSESLKKFDLRAVMEDFDAASTLFDSEMLTSVPEDDGFGDDRLTASINEPESLKSGPVQEEKVPVQEKSAPVHDEREPAQDEKAPVKAEDEDQPDSMKQMLQNVAAAQSKAENRAKHEPLSLGNPDSVAIDTGEHDRLPEVSTRASDSADKYSSVLQGIISDQDSGESPEQISPIGELFAPDTEKKAAEALEVADKETPKLVSAQELLSQLEDSISTSDATKQIPVKPRNNAESIALKLIEELAESVKVGDEDTVVSADSTQTSRVVEPMSSVTKTEVAKTEVAKTEVAKTEVAETKESAASAEPAKHDLVDDIEPYSFAKAKSGEQKEEAKQLVAASAAATEALSISDDDHEDVDSLFSPAKPVIAPTPTISPVLVPVAEAAPVAEAPKITAVAEPVAAATSSSPFQSMVSPVAKSGTDSSSTLTSTSAPQAVPSTSVVPVAEKVATSAPSAEASPAAPTTAAVPIPTAAPTLAAAPMPTAAPTPAALPAPDSAPPAAAASAPAPAPAPVAEAPAPIAAPAPASVTAVPEPVPAPVTTTPNPVVTPAPVAANVKNPSVAPALVEGTANPVVASVPLSATPDPVAATPAVAVTPTPATVPAPGAAPASPSVLASGPASSAPAPAPTPAPTPSVVPTPTDPPAPVTVATPSAVPAPAVPTAPAQPSAAAAQAASAGPPPVVPSAVAAAKTTSAPSFWAEALEKANVAEEPAAAPVAKPEPAANPAVLQSVIIAQLEAQVQQAEGAAAASESGATTIGAKNDLKSALGEALARLAESYYEQGDYNQAQSLYERILLLKQNQLGSKHEALGADLTNLAGVLCVQGKFAEAEPYVKRIATIIEATEPVDTLRLAGCLNTLASVLFQQGKYPECEPLLEKSLRLRREKLGPEHVDIADTLRDYAKLLRKLGRNADAELMYAQAKAILAKRPKNPAPAAPSA